MPDEPATPVAPAARSRWWKWIGRFALAVVVMVVVLSAVFYFFGYDIVKNYIQSDAGSSVAGRELSKAIKVDGKFEPLKVDGWNIDTDSFTSEGWPGEAIGSLDCYDIHAEFDPTAIWHRAWRFSQITTGHASFSLRPPNDALKRVMPPKKPKPWYAIFLPDHFECGPIICPKAEVLFSFQGVDAGIHDAHVQADLIGKDLKYTVTSGTLDFPYLPPMHINRLVMLVTRPAITVYAAELVGIDPGDPATLSLSGRVGMREDKSIDATAALNEVSIEKILPENLRPLIHGKVSGNLVWKRNADGSNVTSEGDLKLTDAGIDNLSVFKEVTALSENPDLNDFPFSDATCHYRLDNGVLTLQLNSRSPGKFHIAGSIAFNVKTKMTDLDLAFDELPLKIWLPSAFKSRYDGQASAKLKWHGQLDTKKDSLAEIGINLDGTHITDPLLLRKLLEKKGFRTPEDIHFDTARFNFTYADETFKLTRANLVAPGVLSAQMTGSLTSDKTLDAAMDWQGLVLHDWLPANIAEQLSGNLDGHVALAVRDWKFGDGSYGGDMHLLNGQVEYTKAQSLLARFLGQRDLLTQPLTRMQLSWTLDDRDITVKGIDIRVGDAVGFKGDMQSDDETGLSGIMWVGTKPEYLEWLPDAEKTIFTRNDDGLVWAKVNLSGTLKKPGQDLGTQVLANLRRHPLALVGLGCKAVSWYVGNWFGEQKNWERPPTRSVVVGTAKP